MQAFADFLLYDPSVCKTRIFCFRLVHSLVTVRMSYINTGYQGEEEGVREDKKREVEINMTGEVNGKMNKMADCEMKICVIGSGDFGRALAGRLSLAGYQVTVASRYPDKNR